MWNNVKILYYLFGNASLNLLVCKAKHMKVQWLLIECLSFFYSELLEIEIRRYRIGFFTLTEWMSIHSTVWEKRKTQEYYCDILLYLKLADVDFFLGVALLQKHVCTRWVINTENTRRHVCTIYRGSSYSLSTFAYTNSIIVLSVMT